MVVDGSTLAGELVRRRVGRSTLIDALRAAAGSTWVPGELRAVPTSLLVLAALSLARSASTPRPAAGEA